MFILPLLALAGGCSAGSDLSASWAARHGGISDDAAKTLRAERIANCLCNSSPKVTVRVLNSDSLCAYAWPDRVLYVTRGLLDRADDNLVAAAIAHELGHLAANDSAKAFVSLTGFDQPLAVEAAADAFGLHLLSRSPYPAQSMQQMLRLVRDSVPSESAAGKSLTKRIDLLDSPNASNR